MYDYREAIENDIREWIKESGETFSDRDEIYDELFTNDSVTGNASGSYTCNAYKAREYVLGDDNAEDYIRELISEYCLDSETIASHLFDWEYWDVSIRCYLLSSVLYDMDDEELNIE